MSTTDDTKSAGKRRKGKGERKKKADARQTSAPVELQTSEPVEPQSPDLSLQSEPEQAIVESPPVDQAPPVAEPVETVAPVEAVAPVEDVAPATAPEAAPSPAEPASTEPTPAPSAEPAPVSLQTIANAYRDYTRKSIEEFGSFVEQLSGARSLDKAMTVQSEFVKRAYETSVAESQKICDLHTRLAKQTLDPFKGLAGKAPPSQGKR
ncbi:phasin family protein [Bradyrhizobium sp. CB3481]|uniref:phasin family protein n=1 Tax=Bradyrhizobium sp. CB3481 TaxID=3039158 RepID=UPI0024B14BBA|nr:phasin family protein [Bradyrhizobium sp. CB3481]WFU19587.1 phasin family protein [Bradyrhizobium sp. CB3481]